MIENQAGTVENPSKSIASISIAASVGAGFRESAAKDRLITSGDFAIGGRQWVRIEKDYAWASFQLQC